MKRNYIWDILNKDNYSKKQVVKLYKLYAAIENIFAIAKRSDINILSTEITTNGFDTLNESSEIIKYFSVIELYKSLLDGSIKQFPKGFWKNDRFKKAKIITKFLIEDVLDWSDKEIVQNFNSDILSKYGLYTMLMDVFKGSIFAVIHNAYPQKYQNWEFFNIYVGSNFWNENTAKDALIWLFEIKLNWTDEQIKESYNVNVIKENNLYGMLQSLFDCSPYKALNFIYPDRFHPWELSKIPQNYWNIKNAREAIKWMIERKLQWNYEDITGKISPYFFSIYRLDNMLKIIYDGSIYNALKDVYPDKDWKKVKLK